MFRIVDIPSTIVSRFRTVDIRVLLYPGFRTVDIANSITLLNSLTDFLDDGNNMILIYIL